MHRDSPAFLRQPGHIDDADTLFFDMSRHADQRANGYDAGPADAGHDH